MKKLLFATFAFVGCSLCAEEFPTIIIETPAFDGVVLVSGAEPAPVCTPPATATPVVYDQPVVYTAPVQYNAPVVYNGPVIYNNTTVTPTRSASCDDFGGMTIQINPRRNRYSRCSNVTVIGSSRVR